MRTFTIHVADAFPSRSSRPSGREARAVVVGLLEAHEVVTLDFDQVPITPSFADELVGALVTTLGPRVFLQRIVLAGLSEDTDSLVQHVVKRRTAQAKHVEHV